MRKTTVRLLASASLVVAACGGDEGGGELFPIKPECEGAAIAAYMGSQPQVINKLEIGSQADGFDLDRDGEPDNKLAAVSSLAGEAITDALANYEIIIPIEFFDMQAAATDQCVKFAVYLGAYAVDTDGDGDKPYVADGDCNDKDMAIHTDAAEVAGNFKDDNCDGRADEDGMTPSTDTMDRDQDGVTIADGDCDDTSTMVAKGMAEVCGDGLDNDCDGDADRTGGMTATACSPFNANAEVPLDPLSFTGTDPVIAFRDGVISEKDGKLVLDAGPSIFSVQVPVSGIDVSLDLRITGAMIQGDVVEENGAIVIKNGRLGGVIDSKTADTIRGLEVPDIGLTPENSLLDATFANLLGPLLALPKAKDSVTKKYIGCRTPDIDVDQDGLEAYCDTDPDNAPKAVDVCVDGDGTEVMDVLDGAGMPIMNCTEAMKGDKFRFVDGISVEFNFETTAIKKILPPR